MSRQSTSVILMIGLVCLVIAQSLTWAEGERDQINRFYSSVVETLKQPKGSLRNLVALVEMNSSVAERCLEAVNKKADIPGEQGEALRLISDELQTAILLVNKPRKCDSDFVQDLLKRAERQIEDDSRILCLERLTAFCEGVGEAYIILGDLFLKQRRCGMAVEAYRKAIELTGDQDSKRLLEEARECKDEYARQKPILQSQVRNLMSQDSTMAPTRQTHRKATIGNSIQRQILFDEWSYRIKDQFLPELRIIGEGLKEGLARNSGARLLIEGHTDRRGPLVRNMQLSRDRAQAIKDHLVKNYGIVAEQLLTEGFGPHRPYSPDDNEAGWALNRRVEFKKLD